MKFLSAHHRGFRKACSSLGYLMDIKTNVCEAFINNENLDAMCLNHEKVPITDKNYQYLNVCKNYLLYKAHYSKKNVNVRIDDYLVYLMY